MKYLLLKATPFRAKTLLLLPSSLPEEREALIGPIASQSQLVVAPLWIGVCRVRPVLLACV